MTTVFYRAGWGLLLLACAAAWHPAQAQKIGYVDSQYILDKLPEYATIQQEIDRLAQDMQAEIQEAQRAVDELFREYQARELLYTNEERQRKREEIVQAEENIARLREGYFGPEGDLFREQEQRMQPLQERVLAAIEEVATADGYDYVFDKEGDLIFLFAREQYDLSDRVLEELGIDLENSRTQGGR